MFGSMGIRDGLTFDKNQIDLTHMRNTLKNQSRPRSNQDALNRVWKHFVVEGNAQCSDAGGCKYRMGLHEACAIGCMIPTKLARRADLLDNSGIQGVLDRMPSFRGWFNKVKKDLLVDLQSSHDYAFDSHGKLKESLVAVAKKHGLTVPVSK